MNSNKIKCSPLHLSVLHNQQWIQCSVNYTCVVSHLVLMIMNGKCSRNSGINLVKWTDVINTPGPSVFSSSELWRSSSPISIATWSTHNKLLINFTIPLTFLQFTFQIFKTALPSFLSFLCRRPYRFQKRLPLPLSFRAALDSAIQVWYTNYTQTSIWIQLSTCCLNVELHKNTETQICCIFSHFREVTIKPVIKVCKKMQFFT